MPKDIKLYYKQYHYVLDVWWNNMSLSEHRVYGALRKLQNVRTLECYPGLISIAAASDYSVRHVQRTLNILKDKGIIKIKQRKTQGGQIRSCYYFAPFAKEFQPESYTKED
jgi:hypothetical protein